MLSVVFSKSHENLNTIDISSSILYSILLSEKMSKDA